MSISWRNVTGSDSHAELRILYEAIRETRSIPNLDPPSEPENGNLSGLKYRGTVDKTYVVTGTALGKADGEGDPRLAADARVGVNERPGKTRLNWGRMGPSPLFSLSALVIRFIGTPIKAGEASTTAMKRATAEMRYTKNFIAETQ